MGRGVRLSEGCFSLSPCFLFPFLTVPALYQFTNYLRFRNIKITDFFYCSRMKIEEFINQKDMYPVFQPVVSFSTGEIFGYEAFARFDEDAGNVSVEELFEQAKKEGCVWALDKQCCKSAVKTARAFGLRKKLFININPLSMDDDTFQEDYTRNLLVKYAMSPEQIIIEITQKDHVGNDVLKSLVDRYRNEGYQIALDNTGAANCGIQEICALNPDFIKIDMSIVRNINGDKIRTVLYS